MPNIFTTEQIRVLNDARTILRRADNTPMTRAGGYADAIYKAGADAIFDTLNVTRSHLNQNISDALLHNDEGDVTRPLGRASDITIVGDECGFELHFTTDDGSYVVNVHAVAQQLVDAAHREIGGWLAEGAAVRATLSARDDDAYDDGGIPRDDPKHPDWHSVHADAYDTMRGDR